MFGIALFVVLLVIGFYLLGDALLRRLRCTCPAEATVELAASQTELQGKRRKAKFPDYHFTVNGAEYHVRDYNAGKAAPAEGSRVLLLCDPARPEKRWYVAGRLWQDIAYGAAALGCAALLLLLYRL